MPKFNIDPRYEWRPAYGRFPAEWSCIDDRTYDGAPDTKGVCALMGWGATQEEALADLERLFEEDAEYQQQVEDEKNRI